jgi:hypothetical protein
MWQHNSHMADEDVLQPLTVQQLINRLSEVENKSLPVLLESWFCECRCWAGNVSVEDHGDDGQHVLIDHLPCQT